MSTNIGEMSAKIITLSVVLILSIQKGRCCPNGWTQYKYSCFHVSRDSQNWFNALKMCEIHDSHLVHIENSEKNIFIKHLLLSSQANNTWLGATDWLAEGTWLWEPHGVRLNYTNFAPGQPNNYNTQNCLLMDALHNYQWNDLECVALTRHYICERGENVGMIIG